MKDSLAEDMFGEITVVTATSVVVFHWKRNSKCIILEVLILYSH